MTEETTPRELSIWESRWQALNTSIEDYQGRLTRYKNDSECNKGILDPSLDILEDMLQRLRNFADAQFHFFYDGLGKQTKYILTKSAAYPRDYVLGVTLKQIAYDLEVIQRAAEQRIGASGDIKRTLERADALAEVAVSSTYNVIDGARPTVITYFEKSHSVRVFPYDHIALIAVPFSCVRHSKGQVTRDFVALLHELGHYVFWHGKIKIDNKDTLICKSLFEALENENIVDHNVWCYRWTEEIFADVIGCLTGGPLIALDFQDLSSAASADEFIEDDKHHPVPAIRPIVYLKTLQKIGGIWGRTVSLLEEHWKNISDPRWKPDKTKQTQILKLIKKSAVSKIPRNDVEAQIQNVINKIFDRLDVLDNPTSKIDLNWSGNAEQLEKVVSDENPEELYDIFQDYLDTGVTPPVEDEASPLPIPTWEQWVNENGCLGKNLDEFVDGELIQPGRTDEEPSGWLNVLFAAGWTSGITATNPSVK